MTHRLGFRGYVLAWAIGGFYLLMVITSPTEMIPFTKDVVVGIFGAANSAGEHVGEAREEYERDQLRQEVEAELRESGWQAPADGETPTTGEEQPTDDEDASRYYGPTDALPDSAGVLNNLRTVNRTIGDGLERHGLALDAGADQ